ncbi:hypothetical protein HDZ31DRAFT_27544, partial [Schizophyllum fasciatum]
VLQPSGVADRLPNDPSSAEDHRNPAGAPTAAASVGRAVRRLTDAHVEDIALETEQARLHVERVRLERKLRDLETREAAQEELSRAAKRRRVEDEEAGQIELEQARSAALRHFDENPDARDLVEERRAQRIVEVKQELSERLLTPPPPGDLHDEELDSDDEVSGNIGGNMGNANDGVGDDRVRRGRRSRRLQGKGPRRGAEDSAMHWPDDHLKNLTAEEKAVPYELYRTQDMDAQTELQRLARIVDHQPTHRAVEPPPCVPDLKAVLAEYNVPVQMFRKVPRRAWSAEPAFRNRVVGITMSERYLVASPNASYIPYVADPDRNMRLRMRIDGCFGAEDMTLVPTYYLRDRAPHLACIPLQPPSPLHPQRVMWMAPEPLLEVVINAMASSSDLVVLKAPVAEQMRRLIVPLRKRVNRYIEDCRAAGEPPVVWARGLEVALGHTYGRLKSIPTSHARAILMVRELQRQWRELKGLITFVLEVQPIMSGSVDPPALYTVRWVLGAITVHPEDAQHLHRAGIPVWIVRRLDGGLLAKMSSEDKRGALYAHYTRKMRSPEEVAETGRHPDNLPYIFEGLPTDFLRVRQMHRYATLSIASGSGYHDDMLAHSGRDPYQILGFGPIYGSSSKERPLEYLSARPVEVGSSKVAKMVEHAMPVVELNVSDAVAAEDPPEAEAFVPNDPTTWPEARTRADPAEYTADIPMPTADAPPTAAIPAMLPLATPPASTRAPPSPTYASGTPSNEHAATSDTVGKGPNKGSTKSATPLWAPIGVHDRPRPRYYSRDHKLHLPQMLPAWTKKAEAVHDSWPSDAGAGDQFRNFPLPSSLVGPNSDEKVARFIQVWLLLSDAAVANARRNPRDRDAFQTYGVGMTWVQPEGQPPVERREDFVEVPAADRTPLIQEEPCLAVSAQVWKDILNAHTSFHSRGNLRGALMDQVRKLLRQTTDFESVRSNLTRRYSIFGEGWIDPGQLPPAPAIKDVLWRLNELVFRKDLVDLDRRARLSVLTPAEEHLRLQNPFDPSTFGADILSVHGRGWENKGLAADDWKERYKYVVGLAHLMRDWHDGLPDQVIRMLEQGTMSEARFEWLEGKVAEHYALQLWRLFHRKVVGPARRS